MSTKLNQKKTIMITKIWYSVQNGGDGSAYPQLMESEKLAELDQEHMDEGWGEPCIGSIRIEHDGPIKILNNIQTAQEIKEEMERVYSNYSEAKEEPKKYEAVCKLVQKQKQKETEDD
jgi:hypothetical protein